MFLALSIALALRPAAPIDAGQYYDLRKAGFGTTDQKVVMENLEKAVKLFDQDGDVMYRYAQALLNQGRHEDAIKAYQKADSLGAFTPKFKANVQYDIACAYAKLGQADPAFTALSKALDLGFRDLQHLRTDSDLDALHKDSRWEKLAATADVSKMSRDEGWRYDLWLLNREVTRIHFSPYRLRSKAEMDGFVQKLNEDIPKLNDNQIMAAFVKYMVMIGDGHTGIRPGPDRLKTIPIQFYQFEEGVYVSAAAPEHAAMAGAQVLEIEGKPIDQVQALLPDYMPRDNAMSLKVGVGRFANLAFLHGVGVADTDTEVTLKIRDRAGATREVTVKAAPGTVSPDWATARDKSNPPLYMRDLGKAYWYEYLPSEKVLYFQYNAVRNQGNESLAAFAEKMFKFIEDNDVKAMVVDCRWNGGGNSFLNRPLTHGILKSKVNKPGSLFVVIGRQTFSACQNFVTDLERETEAIFVGEPSGSSPNFVGETIQFTLPYSKMTGSISDLYWQRSWPMDNRNWIAPDLPAPPTFAALMKNVDPAMEAVRGYLAGTGSEQQAVGRRRG